MKAAIPNSTQLLSTSILLGALSWWSIQPQETRQFEHSMSEPSEPSRRGSMMVADSSKLYLPDDLEATVWAEAPMFYNPTNIDVDARGRIWVTEAVNYRNFNNKPGTRLDHPNGERVMILEDTNGDGKADRAKVYVEDKDLVSPLGIAVIGNKTIVSAAPHLVIYTDENGDDKPDKKEVFLTGFGGLDHDHSLHALVTGPDGKWYFNTGNAGPHTVTDKAGWTLRSGSIYTGGTPYNKLNKGNMVSDDGRVWVGGLALRINPDGTGLKVLGHNFRNNYETAIDSYGNLWQNDNDDQVVACRTSWLMEGGNMGYFSQDGTRFWQGDQRPGQTIPTAHWHQEDPGVIPAGDISGAGSPTGMVFYEGDQLGEKYRGLLLSAEAGRNVIFSYKPEPQGAGYRMPRTDFISTFDKVDEDYKWNDIKEDVRKWFRPSDVTVGTDGALYIADWFDPVVGGHQMKDPKGYGRIYRITPKGKSLKVPEINTATTKGQISALTNPAINIRVLGFDKLRAQGDKVVKPVAKLLDAPNPYHRARAVWLLAQLGPKGRKKAEELLKSDQVDLRVTAFRALKQVQPDVLALARQMVDDPSPAVRREVAIALRDVPFEQCRDLLVKLANHYDGVDRYYLEAVGMAADKKEEELYAALKPLIPVSPLQWDQKTANLIWRLHPLSTADLMKQRALAPTLTADARKQALVALGFMKDPTAARAMVQLTKLDDKTIAQQAEYWANFRRSNDWATLLNWDEVMPPKLSEIEQRALALRQKLMEEYTPAEEKLKLAKEMAISPEGGKLLVGLAAEKKLPESLKPAISEIIFTNPDQSVRTMAGDYFKRPNGATALSLKTIASLAGNETAGLAVFKTTCATCHRHGEQGKDIGPELTKIHQKFDRNGLLDAILNPSAGLAFGYEPWLVTTKNGQTYYGFLISDGQQALVIKDAAGQKHTVPTAQVASRKQYSTSLMPDPASLGLSEQQLADLVAYLLKKP
ncbi:PVC-type heme-binding CxxCH protein [Larkinella insperata]|uniref:PVC-type heme-binding CxxCH protein n=1 Tax=Larkinella insperata TaxID=332158 RepID=A0ABW3QLG0_9BACT|nr:PVC-type heme-binding CxxCH protein [Larkinella insperata]